MAHTHRPAAGSFLAAGLLSLLAALDAHAGSFTIEPVKVMLSAEKTTAVVRVKNPEDSATTVQVESMAWSQEGGDDRLEPTRALLAMPPTFSLAPDGEQIVRVGLSKPASTGTEQAYRLHFRELPPPASPSFKGLRVALQISIPVFVAPPGEAAPEPSWRAELRRDGRLAVTVANTGNAHLRIARLQISRSDDGALIAGDGELIYVLPGNRRVWLLEPNRPLTAGDPLQITIHNNGRTSHARIVVE